MKNFAYPAILTPDQKHGGLTVAFRDIPEAITQGEDVADVSHRLRIVLKRLLPAASGLVWKSRNHPGLSEESV